jgi:ribosomal protein L11 methyltransferase
VRRFQGSRWLGPLSERPFFLLFTGRTISLLGSTVAPVALAFAVIDLTGSPSDLGLVLAASFLPQILFLVVGGVWADRIPRHIVMVGADLVGAAAQAAIAVLLLLDRAEIWHVVVVAVVRGISAAFFMPASSGVVPQTVRPEHLQQANGLLGLTRNATALGGAAFGGLLVAGVGPGWALAVQRFARLCRGLPRQHRQGRRARVRHPADAPPVGERNGQAARRAVDGGPQSLPRLCGVVDQAARRTAGEGDARQMSWRVTVPCSRAQAEALPELDPFPASAAPPVVVADEPDPAKPDEWLLHAYFDQAPTDADLDRLRSLGRGEPHVEELAETDWVTMSQSGLQPIRAGRFFVHTPTYRSHPPGTIAFEVDAGLAFGTGQHATTAGCLEALDKLASNGCIFANVADIGTGTGLLAFAALALWPEAKCIATDVDPVAIDVARENAAINQVRVGHGAGELLLAVADGMDSPVLAARARFDLIIANILAGPLIELAPDFAKSLAPGGTVILAGLLDTQVDTVARAYEAHGLTLHERGSGEWPVLVLGS